LSRAPVRIENRLSDLGVSLLQPLAALRQWAIDHLDDVVLARKAQDVSGGDGAGPGLTKLPPAERSLTHHPISLQAARRSTDEFRTHSCH
jgi:hypothetical protein